ncbi:hypothetical protein DERP_001340 [Dermatophagoides pteronyssinus]|uniref:Uncharacterized protein n=1 Tax=Dermatophagoides pteronyssinus TaxID=6956 RepID=A0ABQ8JE62_DERPT|nr:hypothetical protein DERP_001340 [Dermatophagoides pteronyssinus]
MFASFRIIITHSAFIMKLAGMTISNVYFVYKWKFLSVQSSRTITGIGSIWSFFSYCIVKSADNI